VPLKQDQVKMFLGVQQRNVRQTSSGTASLAFFRLDSSGGSVATGSELKKRAKNVSELGIPNV
jgi:hypothetical protein